MKFCYLNDLQLERMEQLSRQRMFAAAGFGLSTGVTLGQSLQGHWPWAAIAGTVALIAAACWWRAFREYELIVAVGELEEPYADANYRAP